jgi:hypothetical protein
VAQLVAVLAGFFKQETLWFRPSTTLCIIEASSATRCDHDELRWLNSRIPPWWWPAYNDAGRQQSVSLPYFWSVSKFKKLLCNKLPDFCPFPTSRRVRHIFLSFFLVFFFIRFQECFSIPKTLSTFYGNFRSVLWRMCHEITSSTRTDIQHTTWSSLVGLFHDSPHRRRLVAVLFSHEKLGLRRCEKFLFFFFFKSFHPNWTFR